MLTSHSFRMTRAKAVRLLDTLQTGGGSARTSYLPPGLLQAEIEKDLAVIPDPEQAAVALKEASRSSTGAVLFWGEQYRYLVKPPFPLAERQHGSGYSIDTLRALLLRERLVALVLVRLGAYAIGVFQGERLLSSKVGTGNIHQRHHQGGSSAHRFERHRDKQIEGFFTRICAHAREHIEPFARELDHVVFGGTRDTVLELRKQCEFLSRLSDRTMESLLNIREPRQATLEAAIGDVYSCKVVEWREI